MDKKIKNRNAGHAFLSGTLVGILMVIFFGCKQKELKNPYAELEHVVHNDNPTLDNLPEGSFAWLHAKVFRPTCANSGCHDGTFEPEFRSIGSAYNSLVNHPVISNSEENEFVYRVVPGNVNESYLHHRLTVDDNFNSGQMPAALSSGSDWPQMGSNYVEKINQWISAGAKDMYGNAAPSATANTPPLVLGLVVFPHNNTSSAFPRESDPQYGIGAIEVPAQLVDIWILPFDDTAYPDQFPSISLMASTSSLDFSNAMQTTFSLASPITAMPFGDGDPAPFYYKTTLDLSATAPGDFYYLRTYINDGYQSGFTEIPNSESNPFWYLIFSLKII